jgi:hypothetical protein
MTICIKSLESGQLTWNDVTRERVVVGVYRGVVRGGGGVVAQGATCLYTASVIM